MAVKTDTQLTTDANQVANEQGALANSAIRIGALFNNLVENKINNDKVISNVLLPGTDNLQVPSVPAVRTAIDTGVNTAKAYADGLVVGLLDDRGNHNASVNAFPTTGGSGISGAIKKGDLWTILNTGTLGSATVTTGDVIRALVDTPGQTSSNWAVTENNIGFIPESVGNKSVNITADAASTTKYPSVKLIKDYVDLKDYKVFAFALTKVSTTITNAVQKNELLPITFSFTNPANGFIYITASAPVFDATDTFYPGGTLNNAGSPYFITGSVFSSTVFLLSLIKYDGTQTGTPDFADLFIELRKYN